MLLPSLSLLKCCYVVLLSQSFAVASHEHQVVLADVASQKLSASGNLVLNFDDINTVNKSPLPFLANPYQHFTFSSFHIHNNTDKSHIGFHVDPDCALSPPNSLVASRAHNPWPRFLLDADKAKEAGLAPFFNFHSIAYKAMGNTKPYNLLVITALGIIDHGKVHDTDDSGSLQTLDLHKMPRFPTHGNSTWYGGRYEVIANYSLYRRALSGGQSRQLVTNITAIFPHWGKGVNTVEIYAEGPREPRGEEGDDLPFCMDDLGLEMMPIGKHDDMEEVLQEWKDIGRFMEKEVVVLGDGTVQERSSYEQSLKIVV